MTLTPEEQTYVRSQGLYLTAKCDACEAILNQSVRLIVETECSLRTSLIEKREPTRDGVRTVVDPFKARNVMPSTAVIHAENGILGETEPTLLDRSKNRGHRVN